MKQLTTSETASNGGILTLSDSQRYLVLQQRQRTSAQWAGGECVLVASTRDYPDSFTLRSALRTGEPVVAVLR